MGNLIVLEVEEDSTDEIWGVLDTVPITYFPDMRMRCVSPLVRTYRFTMEQV